MRDMKKFLDQEGLALLWRKIEAELKTRDGSISNLSDLIEVVETTFNEYKVSNNTAVQTNTTDIASVSRRVDSIVTEINNAEAFEPISDSDIDALFT